MSDQLDSAARVPKYFDVAQLLRQRIMAGEFAKGDILPGEHALRDHYRVSVATVRSALSVLRGEGLLVTRSGVGSKVASVPPKIIIRAGRGDKVSSRMPTVAERKVLGLPEGVWVIALERPGRAEELYDASRAEIEIEG